LDVAIKKNFMFVMFMFMMTVIALRRKRGDMRL